MFSIPYMTEMKYMSGADPGFGVRGGEIRRGVWGPPPGGGTRGAKTPEISCNKAILEPKNLVFSCQIYLSQPLL